MKGRSPVLNVKVTIPRSIKNSEKQNVKQNPNSKQFMDSSKQFKMPKNKMK
jgi:hypothetical protein